jgi:hypothetical protein
MNIYMFCLHNTDSMSVMSDHASFVGGRDGNERCASNTRWYDPVVVTDHKLNEGIKCPWSCQRLFCLLFDTITTFVHSLPQVQRNIDQQI